MTRRDTVIVDILILLSFASTPLILFRLFSLSSTFLLRERSEFISSFYKSVILSSSPPSRFFILLCLSIVPVLSYTALLSLPSSSSADFLFLFSSCLLCLYPVIISSPFLLVFFYRAICFSSSVFSSFHIILRIS